MIRVSNLRKEHLPESQEYRIVCDVDCPFSQSKQLWFSVPSIISLHRSVTEP